MLPEAEPFTFTGFIVGYFGDRSELGYRREGPGANLAFSSQVRSSRETAGFEAQRAVDGNTETWWGSSDFALQWIEMDLGDLHTIRLFRLLTAQSPPGETIHQLWVGPTSNQLYLLHTFEGHTSDLQVLEFSPADPVENVRFVRVVTTQSPSWVAWREIEIIAAE